LRVTWRLPLSRCTPTGQLNRSARSVEQKGSKTKGKQMIRLLSVRPVYLSRIKENMKEDKIEKIPSFLWSWITTCQISGVLSEQTSLQLPPNTSPPNLCEILPLIEPANQNRCLPARFKWTKAGSHPAIVFRPMTMRE
jgi:hypothetical protein